MDESRARRTMSVIFAILVICCLTAAISTALHMRHTAPRSTKQESTTSTPKQQSQTKTTKLPPSAISVMAGIVEAEPVTEPYIRANYQPNWDVGSGCDIRSRMLSGASLTAVRYAANGCTVVYGSWSDPYTGQTLTGDPYEGDGTANDLDIDHVIPLGYVNEHGGYQWSAAQKLAYGDSLTAMQNGVYLAVSAEENVKKGDNGPSIYYPPNPAYKCTYAQKWRDIARTYHISLAPADYTLIANTMMSCGLR